MRAGTLRHKIRIERYAYLTDDDGNVIQDPSTGETSQEWQLVAEPWASIEPLSAREFLAAQAAQSKISARIVIRYRDGLDAAMRIVHRSKIYNIEGSLADKNSGLEYLTLPVSEGVGDGS